MPCAVVLLFDSPLDLAVRKTWDLLEQRVVASFRTTTEGRHAPHLTLAVAESIDAGLLRAEVARQWPTPQRPTLVLDHLGVFPGRGGVLFLGAVPTEELLAIHRTLYPLIERASRGLDALYAPGRWVPHCTLAMPVSADEVARVIASVTAPLSGKAAEIAVVDVATGAADRLVRLSE